VTGRFAWPHFTSLPVPSYQVLGTKHYINIQCL
jgi:hypothetical protein